MPVTGTVTFKPGINWGCIPITQPTSINSLFNGIDTSGIVITSETSYPGIGNGFVNAATLLQPNQGFVLKNTKNPPEDITLQYSIHADQATGVVQFRSGINWGCIPIKGPTNIDTLFQGQNTNGIVITSETSYPGIGNGFVNSATLLQPNQGFVLKNTKDPPETIKLQYSYV